MKRIIELKVKVVSLMQEAQYIRRSERKLKKRLITTKMKAALKKIDLQEVQAILQVCKPSIPKPKRLELEHETRRHYREMRRKVYKDAALGLSEASEQRLREQCLRLQQHRTGMVRHEARCSQLAYAFLRGVPYCQVEVKVHDHNKLDGNDKANIALIVDRFAYQQWTHSSARKKHFSEVNDWIAGKPVAV